MSLASPQLRGLLETSQALRSSPDVPTMLEAVAATVARTLGFGTVAINLYRPAWDDYMVVVVHGSEQAHSVLSGTTSSAAVWASLMQERFGCAGAFFVPSGTFDWDSHDEITYVPDLEPVAAPDAWLPEDALFVPLYASDGEIQGILSVDEPRSGLRPCAEELETLVAVTAQAALAIESAQHAEEASRRRSAAEHLLRVSAALTKERRVDQLLDEVCHGVSDALDFDRVVFFLHDAARGCLTPAASSGWRRAEIDALPDIEPRELSRLLRPELEEHGCLLLDRHTAQALTGARLHHLHTSETNGRGPLAWVGHWLLVALRDSAGGLQGILWADDPRDRLRPKSERLQLLRTFANQASSALEATQHTERLRHLAEHDPLTGLRNRRGLRQRVDALIQESRDGAVGLIVFDIDAFKRINDRLGHEVGDHVLRAVAAILEAECPPDGLAVRLGGEDFALLLSGAHAGDVLSTAERVKAVVCGTLTSVPWTVTLSVGVAIADDKIDDAATLLRAGTRALFAAKRLGRDRIVLYSAEALEALLGTLEDLGNGEQLAAMVLLAETLDLRDPRTARHSQTVGRHAERLATALGWSPARVERIRIAGVLHDIGKLGLPDAILHKPDRLDAAEWTEIERHPEMGARILDHANLRDVAAWVRCHHERVDGTGYPRRLAGDEIPLEARILAVADAYEAMTADRSYRLAMPPAQALEELLRERDRQFDATVVDAFRRAVTADASAFAPD